MPDDKGRRVSAAHGRRRPVTRGAAVLEALIEGGVKPIRIGLQATEALSVGSEVYAGANHSALGEKIEGEYYRRLLRKETEKLCTSRADKPETLTVLCAPGEESKVSGQNKANRLWLAETLFGTTRDPPHKNSAAERHSAVYGRYKAVLTAQHKGR